MHIMTGLLGAAVGMAIAAVIWAVVVSLRKKRSGDAPQFDERQLAARAKAYSSAFFTLLGYLAVVALLVVQAYCDLSLPDYTSKIVDTGIQQGGIESPLPQTVRQSTLDALSLLMSEEDAQKLQNAYQYYLQDDGVLQLRSDLTEDERTALEDAVTTPDICLLYTSPSPRD